jgi:hypothetical protein
MLESTYILQCTAATSSTNCKLHHDHGLKRFTRMYYDWRILLPFVPSPLKHLAIPADEQQPEIGLPSHWHDWLSLHSSCIQVEQYVLTCFSVMPQNKSSDLNGQLHQDQGN